MHVNYAKYQDIHQVCQLCKVSRYPPRTSIMQSIKMSNNYMVVPNLYSGVSRNTDSRCSELVPLCSQSVTNQVQISTPGFRNVFEYNMKRCQRNQSSPTNFVESPQAQYNNPQPVSYWWFYSQPVLKNCDLFQLEIDFFGLMVLSIS